MSPQICIGIVWLPLALVGLIWCIAIVDNLLVLFDSLFVFGFVRIFVDTLILDCSDSLSIFLDEE